MLTDVSGGAYEKSYDLRPPSAPEARGYNQEKTKGKARRNRIEPGTAKGIDPETAKMILMIALLLLLLGLMMTGVDIKPMIAALSEIAHAVR
jgi:hypothetical protein